MDLCLPVIVVPGITATQLQDEYPIPAQLVWSVLTRDYERVSMHPDDVRYEAREPARMRAGQPLEIAYRELVEELRHNLRQKEDQPVPVYLFGYDWRQPLEHTEQQLAAFIDEVIERTVLMRHYVKDGYGSERRVNLVGHSMGGLVITGCLERQGRKARVAKVATLATPFCGSFEAIIQLATGTAALGAAAPSSREREAARVTPAVYHLLPTCPGLESNNRRIYDPEIWQQSILDTLEEYVRLHAVSTKDRKMQARELFAALLKAAEQHRDRIDSFRLSAAGLKNTDWLCVAGVDAVTRVGVRIDFTRRGPQFFLDSRDRKNEWDAPGTPAQRRLTGDGTVPLAGAIPKFLSEANLVCVRPADYGYWELQDRVTTRLAGFHGILPNMDMLHRLVVRHLTGRADRHRSTWGRPVPGVTQWQPPLELHDKTAEDAGAVDAPPP